MTVAITRLDRSADDLRREASRCRDGAAARRMLALALVLEGCSRAEAARLCGMDRQTLRDWVHRYNAEGLAGLCDRPHVGRPACLTAEQMAELERLVEHGPDPEQDGVVRWRRIDLQAVIADRYEVDLHERSVGKLLHRLRFARLSARPQHPQSDPAAQETFKKTLPRSSPPRSWNVSPAPATRSRSGSRTKPVSASRGR
jgi:transposase